MRNLSVSWGAKGENLKLLNENLMLIKSSDLGVIYSGLRCGSRSGILVVLHNMGGGIKLLYTLITIKIFLYELCSVLDARDAIKQE